MIKHIKTLKELSEELKKLRLDFLLSESRYATFSEASLKYIFHELFARYEVWYALSHLEDPRTNFMAADDLFAEREVYSSNWVPIDSFEPRDCINQLSDGDILLEAYILMNHYGIEKLDGEWFDSAAANIPRHTYSRGPNIYLSVAARVADNQQLRKEFSAKLQILRAQLNLPKPKLKHVSLQIQKLLSGEIFQYLDLELWAQVANYQIENSVYTDLFFGAEKPRRPINLSETLARQNVEKRKKLQKRNRYDPELPPTEDTKFISNRLRNDAYEAIDFDFIRHLEDLISAGAEFPEDLEKQ